MSLTGDPQKLGPRKESNHLQGKSEPVVNREKGEGSESVSERMNYGSVLGICQVSTQVLFGARYLRTRPQENPTYNYVRQ